MQPAVQQRYNRGRGDLFAKGSLAVPFSYTEKEKRGEMKESLAANKREWTRISFWEIFAAPANR